MGTDEGLPGAQIDIPRALVRSDKGQSQSLLAFAQLSLHFLARADIAGEW